MNFEFLQPRFDDQLTAEVGQNNRDIIIAGSSFSASQILRNVDSTIYDEAFIEWRNNYFQDCKDRANEIISSFNNRDRFLRLQESIRTDSVIPFVGAGMSCASGFRLWNRYLHFLREDSNISEQELDEMLNNGQYEIAAERLLNDLGENLFDERLHTAYRAYQNNTIRGAVHYFPYIFRKAVVTTNFDNVLEKVYETHNTRFSRTLLGTQGANFIQHITDNIFCLYKIHGDFAEPETRVLTLNEYQSAYAEDSRLVNTLKLAFSSNTFFFVGCSLNQDRTMQLMEILANERRNLPRHYALLSSPINEGERQERQRFLARRNIFPIWYPTNQHDDSVEAIFVKLLSDRNVL